ncbi:MAG TPA: VPLPA-CTERM sorting domain-containing protein [Acidiferrobacterales bacterium]|jgi:hypothetical protein
MDRNRTSIAALGVAFLAAGLAAPADAAIVYANQVTSLVRGDTTIGNVPGYYGGYAPFTDPVELSAEQAIANVLGAPDGNFTTLPGRNDTMPGDPWPYMYIEFGFGTTFTPQDTIVISEFGHAFEAARVWVYSTTGESVQATLIRYTADDTLTLDLSPWAGQYAAFDRVGIGGLDLLGTAQGFDLDAVGVDITPIPLPAAGWLLLSGLLAAVGLVRRRGRME